MARNGSGTASIPNSFSAGTTIQSSTMNANFSDVASMLTSSLCTDGQTSMSGPFKAAVGSVSAPGITFGSETTGGFYRIGSNNWGAAANSTKIWEWDTTGLTVASGLALKVGTGTAYVSGGTDVAVADGGTGVSALTAHYLLVGNGTSALTLVAPSATSGVPLISQGSSSDPVYGTAVVAGGGTGITSATAYAVLCGGTTSTGAFQSVASVGSSGQALLSNGAGSTPTFQAIIPAYAAGTYATNTTISGTIPYDDTIPQIGEGTEIISISITPIRSTSKIKVSFAGQGGVASAGPMTAALFVNGGSDAVQAAVFQTTSVNTEYPCSFEYSYAPGSTSAQTIALRVGSNSGNSFMNGNSTAGRKYGGAQATTLIAQEIFQ